MSYPGETNAAYSAMDQAKMQARASQIGNSTLRDQTPLESLAGAVHRINGATVNVQCFLSRFHGEEPTSDNSGEAGAIMASPPHRQTIERLFSALDRLEQHINQLSQIG